MIGGVAGGIAEYSGLDPVLIRVIFVALACMNGVGIFLYIVLMIVVPERSSVASVEAPPATDSAAIPAQVMERVGDKKSFRLLIAGVLIAFGCLALVREIFGIQLMQWSLIWPIAVVVLGVYLLIKRK